jgi:membrane associated rhomboid family serine protease
MTENHPATVPEQAEPVCPRHPGTVAYVRCQRCGRPTCPACQRPAAVGVQCVDCVAEGARSVRGATTVFGGRVTDGRPLVTWTIMAICAVVWLGELTSTRVYQEVAFAPFLGESEPWRFLTSAFAHSPSVPLHIMFNMYALFVLGGYLEPALGRARFLAAYLVSALGGSVVYLLLTPRPDLSLPPQGQAWYGGMVGASGAVFGLFGVYLVVNRVLKRSNTAMFGTLAINAAFGFLYPGIAWQAHLGGLLTGIACAGAVAAFRAKERRGLQWAGFAAVTALLVVLTVGKYALVA